MIRFYYLVGEAAAEPCVLCAEATTNRAGYNPPGVKVEKAVCDRCYRQASKLVGFVARLMALGGR